MSPSVCGKSELFHFTLLWYVLKILISKQNKIFSICNKRRVYENSRTIFAKPNIIEIQRMRVWIYASGSSEQKIQLFRFLWFPPPLSLRLNLEFSKNVQEFDQKIFTTKYLFSNCLRINKRIQILNVRPVGSLSMCEMGWLGGIVTRVVQIYAHGLRKLSLLK